MLQNRHRIALLLGTVLIILGFGCQGLPSGDAPNREIVGRWHLLTLTDMQDDLTLKAGIKTDIGEGEMRNVNIKSHFSDDDRYETIWRVISSRPGYRQDVYEDTTRGSYQISLDTLKTTNSLTGETEISIFTVNGDRLTLRHATSVLVLQRQVSDNK